MSIRVTCYKKKDSYSVFAKEEFEHQFEADLQLHTANIKEEIKIYGKKYYRYLVRNAGSLSGQAKKETL